MFLNLKFKSNIQFKFKLNRKKRLKLIFHNIEIQDGSQLSDLCSKFADINHSVRNARDEFQSGFQTYQLKVG